MTLNVENNIKQREMDLKDLNANVDALKAIKLEPHQYLPASHEFIRHSLHLTDIIQFVHKSDAEDILSADVKQYGDELKELQLKQTSIANLKLTQSDSGANSKKLETITQVLTYLSTINDQFDQVTSSDVCEELQNFLSERGIQLVRDFQDLVLDDERIILSKIDLYEDSQTYVIASEQLTFDLFEEMMQQLSQNASTTEVIAFLNYLEPLQKLREIAGCESFNLLNILNEIGKSLGYNNFHFLAAYLIKTAQVKKGSTISQIKFAYEINFKKDEQKSAGKADVKAVEQKQKMVNEGQQLSVSVNELGKKILESRNYVQEFLDQARVLQRPMLVNAEADVAMKKIK